MSQTAVSLPYSPLALMSQEELTLISNALSHLLQAGTLCGKRHQMAYDLIQDITQADNLNLPHRRPSTVFGDKGCYSFNELSDLAKKNAYENWKAQRVKQNIVSYDTFTGHEAHQWEYDKDGQILDIPF